MNFRILVEGEESPHAAHKTPRYRNNPTDLALHKRRLGGISKVTCYSQHKRSRSGSRNMQGNRSSRRGGLLCLAIAVITLEIMMNSKVEAISSYSWW